MSNTENDEIKIKLIVLGNAGVGKTSIIINFFGGEFQEEILPSTSPQYEEKQLNINDKKVKVRIWDTAGQESYSAITRNHYKGTNIVIFIYDITKKESFERIKNYWYKEFKEECGDIKGKKIYLIIFSNWNFWK